MKLSVASFFASNSNKATNKKKNKNKNKSRDADADASFGSNASSSDSSTSSSLLYASPRSVLPPFSTDGLEAVFRSLGGPDPLLAADEAAGLAGCITAEDLEALGAAPAAEAEAELREAFGAYDADRDGKISAEDLLAMFVRLGDDGCSLEDCRRMIRAVDSDGDGFVCFDDFARMMDDQRLL